MLLPGCGLLKPVIRTEVVEVERTRFVRIDPALTQPCKLPPLPDGTREPDTVDAYLAWVEEVLVVVNGRGGCSWRFKRIEEVQNAVAPSNP